MAFHCNLLKLTILNAFQCLLNSVVLKEGVKLGRFFFEESFNFASRPEDAMVRVVREGLEDTKGNVLTVTRVLDTRPGFGHVRDNAL